MNSKLPKKISIAEPVTDLRRVRIEECGEPLVDFMRACPGLILARGRFDYRRETLLRSTAAQMLCVAAGAAPPGYRLATIEGWRAPHIQRRMYAAVWKRFQDRYPDWSDTRLRRTVNRFTAPMNLRVPPPHSTGGALDVLLLDEAGNEVDMTSPFKRIDPKCYAADCPRVSETAAMHRRILRETMLTGGFTNYPSEYWHWSYGDQGWAYRGGHSAARYGSITPDGWQPDPADATDEPLVFREE